MFGRVGQQQANDCTIEAGRIADTPIKVHYFLIAMFVYQVLMAFQQSMGNSSLPLWFFILYAAGSQLLLVFTVLVHELGHGLTARYLGGSIAQILLWPFGGICFSTRPENVVDRREKIKNELKIVCGGPATHFLQAPAWIVIMGIMQASFSIKLEGEGQALYWLLLPFVYPNAGMAPMCPSGFDNVANCLPNPWMLLIWWLCRWAVTMNIYLFIFNVFFPMYPMDSAKICVCTIQLCGCSARTAAKFLIYTSVPLCILLFVNGWRSGLSSGNFMTGLSMYLAIMCLMEAWNIHKLMEKQQLHTHHLFEGARSDTVSEGGSGTRRLNVSRYDDMERGAGTTNSSNYVLFSGSGNTGGETSDDLGVGRKGFLDRMDRDSKEKKMSVRDLQEQAENVRNQVRDRKSVV